jgi:hypothetical protein
VVAIRPRTHLALIFANAGVVLACGCPKLGLA